MSATAALAAAAIADITSDGNSVAPLTATLAIMTGVVAVAPRTYPTVRAVGDRSARPICQLDQPSSPSLHPLRGE